MKEKKIKEGQVLDVENTGNYNVIGNNANYEQMLGAIDKLNKSGQLDYLKKK